MRHFEDLGIVSARTGWSGREDLVVFKCGPFIGHHALGELPHNAGGFHAHPDAGHFVVFGNGEWLICDDGKGEKWTRNHNTLLIDGRGQLGDDGYIVRDYLETRARPHVASLLSRPQLDHIAADVTPAYPRDLGLQRFVRHLLFLKPDVETPNAEQGVGDPVLLVLDDVLCEADRQLELRFHPESMICERVGDSTVIAGEKTVLQMGLLTPENVTTVTQRLSADRKHGREDDFLAVRYSRSSRSWRNAVALSWTPIGRQSKIITLNDSGNIWTFLMDGKKVVFDWNSGKVVEP